jgi:hypothetical protein
VQSNLIQANGNAGWMKGTSFNMNSSGEGMAMEAHLYKFYNGKWLPRAI